MGLSQQPRLFSGGRLVKRKVSGNSTYSICFTEMNKIKRCWEGKRTLTFFPEDGMLTLKEKKCCFLVPVPWMLRILCSNCFPKKGYWGIQESPSPGDCPKH